MLNFKCQMGGILKVLFVTKFTIEESNMLVKINMFGFSHHIIKLSIFPKQSHNIIQLTLCAMWTRE